VSIHTPSWCSYGPEIFQCDSLRTGGLLRLRRRIGGEASGKPEQLAALDGAHLLLCPAARSPHGLAPPRVTSRETPEYVLRKSGEPVGVAPKTVVVECLRKQFRPSVECPEFRGHGKVGSHPQAPCLRAASWSVPHHELPPELSLRVDPRAVPRRGNGKLDPMSSRVFNLELHPPRKREAVHEYDCVLGR
jgi:hypothetical protein